MRSLKISPLFAAVGICVGAFAGSAQDKIKLYDGAAPGSESWTHSEKEVEKPHGAGLRFLTW